MSKFNKVIDKVLDRSGHPRYMETHQTRDGEGYIRLTGIPYNPKDGSGTVVHTFGTLLDKSREEVIKGGIMRNELTEYIAAPRLLGFNVRAKKELGI